MPAHERTRRRWIVLAVAAVVILLVTAAAAHRVAVRDPGGPDGPGDTDGTGPAERAFAWLANPRGPFTDAQIRALATGYSTVVMDRAHGGADIAVQLDDARRIKQVAPATRVLIYVNAAFWYDTNGRPDGWDAPYDPAWSLADPDGTGPLRFRGASDREQATFVDLGNPAYRTSLLRLVRSWADRAPIDGIAFDSVQPAFPGRGVVGHPGLTWADVLPGPRLARYNDGLRALLRDTRSVLGPDREVLFNGIADTALAPDRNIGLVDDTDGAVDESFCLDNALRHDPDKLRADLALMSDLARRGKRLLEKTNTRGMPAGPERDRLGRYCAGAFLLGWQPGSTFFKFGPGYTTDELQSNPAELQIRLGRPLGDHVEQAGTARRDFENGTVLVNLSDRPTTVDGTTLAAQDAAVVPREPSG